MKVLIVEDSRLLRERIEKILSSIENVEVVGFVDSSESALQAIAMQQPDLLLLDLALAKGSGVDVLQRAQVYLPKLTIMVLTNYAYQALRGACLRMGARYFFDKSTEFEEAIETITSLALKVHTAPNEQA